MLRRITAKWFVGVIAVDGFVADLEIFDVVRLRTAVGGAPLRPGILRCGGHIEIFHQIRCVAGNLVTGKAVVGDDDLGLAVQRFAEPEIFVKAELPDFAAALFDRTDAFLPAEIVGKTTARITECSEWKAFHGIDDVLSRLSADRVPVSLSVSYFQRPRFGSVRRQAEKSPAVAALEVLTEDRLTDRPAIFCGIYRDGSFAGNKPGTEEQREKQCESECHLKNSCLFQSE